MLPKDDRNFRGRDGLLQALINAYDYRDRSAGQPGPRSMTLLVGPAGVGKSAVAQRVGHDLHERGVSVLYYDVDNQLEDHLQPSHILRRFLGALSHEDSSRDFGSLRAEYGKDSGAFTEELLSQFKQYLDDQEVIVVLDNVETLDMVAKLVPRGSDCYVIATGRKRFTEDIKIVEVPPMPDDEAITLFNWNRRTTPPDEEEQFRALIERTERLPIVIRALALCLWHFDHCTVETLVREFDRVQAAEDFRTDMDALTSWQKVVYGILPEPDKRLFRRLFATPGRTFSVGLVARLAGTSKSEAAAVLRELRELSLIQEAGEGYYTMHALWNAFARKMLADQADESMDEFAARACHYYLEQVRQNNRTLVSISTDPDDEDALASEAVRRGEAIQWFDRELVNLVAVVHEAASQLNDQLPTAVDLCHELVEYFDIQCEWESWETTHLEVRRHLGPSGDGAAETLHGLGRFYAAVHQWDKSIENFRRSIVVVQAAESEPNPDHLALSYLSLADVFRYMRSWHAAGACLKRAEEILDGEAKGGHGTKGGEPSSATKILRGRILRSKATISRLGGEYLEAKDLCLHALNLFKDVGNQRWISAANLSLAEIMLDENPDQLSEAIEKLDTCRRFFEAIGDKHWITLTLRSLGDAYCKMPRINEAKRILDDSIKIAKANGDRLWSAEATHSMGVVLMRNAEFEKAKQHFERALDWFGNEQDTLWQGRVHVSLGKLFEHQEGLLDSAIESYCTALPLLVEQGAEADWRAAQELLARCRKRRMNP